MLVAQQQEQSQTRLASLLLLPKTPPSSRMSRTSLLSRHTLLFSLPSRHSRSLIPSLFPVTADGEIAPEEVHDGLFNRPPTTQTMKQTEEKESKRKLRVSNSWAFN